MNSKHTKKNHKEIMYSIKKNKKNIKSLEQQLKTIHNNLKNFSNTHTNLKESELEQKMLLLDKKKKIETSIEHMKNDKALHSFLLNNSKDLFNIDNKKKMIDKKDLKNNNVLQYFNKKLSPINNSVLESKDIEKKKFNNREFNNDNNNIKNVCYDCNKEKILYKTEGIIVCPKCGIQENILIDYNKASYKQAPREMSYFAYKRINHFNEWLAQFQAKESTDIPKNVYDDIINEINKESYLSIDTVTIPKLRSILKKLKLNKYYEHVPHIINRLTGSPAPTITREIEMKLRSMFKEIQNPWIKFCPNNRSNFLSYSYVLYKCLQLLEKDEYLEHFTLLKSREKLAEQDKIWKCICSELRWEYIQTI
jgi:hypothetical protein